MNIKLLPLHGIVIERFGIDHSFFVYFDYFGEIVLVQSQALLSYTF